MATKKTAKRTPRKRAAKKPGPPGGYRFCPWDGCNRFVPEDDPLSCDCEASESLRQARERERAEAYEMGKLAGTLEAKEAYDEAVQQARSEALQRGLEALKEAETKAKMLIRRTAWRSFYVAGGVWAIVVGLGLTAIIIGLLRCG